MIIETSQDILWLAIAFAVVLVAVFFSWLMYVIIAMLRDIHVMVRETKEWLDRFEEFFQSFAKKAEGIFNIVPIIGEGMKALVGYVMENREEKKRRR